MQLRQRARRGNEGGREVKGGKGESCQTEFIIDILKLHRGMTGIDTLVMGRTVRDGEVQAEDGIMGGPVME